jgi:hypothetical protein
MKKSITTLLVAFLLSVSIKANSQWVQMSNGIGNEEFVLSLAVSGTYIFAGTSGIGVYRSTNNGTSWTQTSLNNKTILSLAVSGTYIFAGTAGVGVYRSTNNGTSWTQTSLNNQIVYSLMSLGTYIFAGTGNGIYRSTNNGTNWTQSGLNTSISVYSLAVSGNNTIFAGTWSNGIYMSTNNGTNWPLTVLTERTIYSFATNGDNVFAGTYFSYPGAGDGGVYRSENNGMSWFHTALNNQSVFSLCVSGNNVFAGTADGAGVYLSKNNGVSWIQRNEGFSVTSTVRALLITNNYIFAGTNGNSVWRRGLSEILTDYQQISELTPASYSLHQNYPNPFNPSTNIRYDIPKNGFVKLVVYDMLGKEIETLVNEKQSAGTCEATFDATNYVSGVYFYRLTTNGFSETKRMILLK